LKRVGYITDKDGRRITLLEAMGDYGNVQKAITKPESVNATEKTY
jgi:hypothetical protein